MKIEVSSPAASAIATDRSAKQPPSGVVNEARLSPKDRTTFQSDGASVQALTNQALQSPEVRQNKIDALRTSIQSGTYQVDTAKIAAAIPADELK